MNVQEIREINDEIQEVISSGRSGEPSAQLLKLLSDLDWAVRAEDQKDHLVRVAIRRTPVPGNMIPAVSSIMSLLPEKGISGTKEALARGEVYVYRVSVAETLVNSLNQITGVSAWIA